MGIASWLRAAIIRPARFWFCPNGGNLSRAQAGQFKEMGLTAGVHDLHFMWRETDHAGFLGPPRFGTIELKAPNAKKNALREGQVDFGADMDALGHPWAECRSLDEVLAVLKRWGFPLREPRDAVKYAVANGLKITAYPAVRF